MNAGTVRVGVIGTGSHAMGVHFPSLAELDDVEIGAICDVDAQARKEASKQYRVAATYASYREMLDREALDAVFVVIPPQFVYPIAADILRRRIPLFVEKPPALTAYQTKCLAELASEHHTISFVGFNRRYAPTLVESRRLLEQYGPLDHFVFTFCKHSAPDARPYYDGVIDVLMCDAVHAVDSVRWLGGGPPAQLSAVTRVSHTNRDAKYIALMQFEGGCTGVLNCNWNSGARILTAEMHSPGACAHIEVERSTRLQLPERGVVELSAADLAGGEGLHRTGGYFQENRCFIDCVKSGTEPQNNLADSYYTMALAEDIYRASPEPVAHGQANSSLPMLVCQTPSKQRAVA